MQFIGYLFIFGLEMEVSQEKMLFCHLPVPSYVYNSNEAFSFFLQVSVV